MKMYVPSVHSSITYKRQDIEAASNAHWIKKISIYMKIYMEYYSAIKR